MLALVAGAGAAAAPQDSSGTGAAVLAAERGANPADVLYACRAWTEAGRNGGGCSAISPSGISWSYIMPQHTATGTIARYLTKTLGIASCHHMHTFGHPGSVTTSFRGDLLPETIDGHISRLSGGTGPVSAGTPKPASPFANVYTVSTTNGP